jgi:hypothetical protein
MSGGESIPEVAPIALLDHILTDEHRAAAPPDVDFFTLRAVHPDLRSSRGYRYPWPGQWAVAPGPIIETNHGYCPEDKGDGLCVGLTWAGMASGSIPAICGLLVGISRADVLGMDGDKARVRRLYVVDVVDLARAVRDHGDGANLTRADLTGADLTGANLTGANLTGANLTRANLTWAHLSGADLTRANLTGADLTGANLTGANLSGANWNEYTRWPAGYTPPAADAQASAAEPAGEEAVTW